MTPEEAKQILEADKKERAEQAAAEVNAIEQKYNVKFEIITTVGNHIFFASDIVKTPLTIKVTAL